MVRNTKNEGRCLKLCLHELFISGRAVPLSAGSAMLSLINFGPLAPQTHCVCVVIPATKAHRNNKDERERQEAKEI